jgi:hypothetical protein
MTRNIVKRHHDIQYRRLWLRDRLNVLIRLAEHPFQEWTRRRALRNAARIRRTLILLEGVFQ